MYIDVCWVECLPISTFHLIQLRHLKLSLVGWMHKDKALLTSNHAIDIILEICHHPNIFKGEIREAAKSIDSKLNGREKQAGLKLEIRGNLMRCIRLANLEPVDNRHFTMMDMKENIANQVPFRKGTHPSKDPVATRCLRLCPAFRFHFSPGHHNVP